MHISYLLVISLLSSLPATALAAQSNEPSQSVPSQSVPAQSAPDQSVPDQSVPDQSVPDQSVPDQSVPNLTFFRATLSGITIEFGPSSQEQGTPSTVKAKSLDEKARDLELTQKARDLMEKLQSAAVDARARNYLPCYSIESYRFTQENPNSDVTKLTQHSACQPAAQFQLKPATPPATPAAH